VAVMSAVVLAMYLTPRFYTATSGLVLVSPQKPDSNGALSPPQPADAATVDTEVQLAESAEVADGVVDQLHLADRLGFWAAFGRTPPRTEAERRRTAVLLLRSSLKARRSGLSSIVTLSVTLRDPTFALALADAYADQCIAAQARAKLDVAQRSGRVLDRRLQGLRATAVRDAAELARFRQGHQLYSSRGAELVEVEASAYAQQLAQAKADHDADQARLSAGRRELASDGDGATALALDSPVLQGLRAQRAQLTAQIAGLQNRYGPRHPDLIAAGEQLADVDSGLRAEAARQMADLQTRTEVSGGRVASLGATLKAAQARLNASAAASVTLDELQREADVSRQIYQDYLLRQRQAEASLGTELPDARVSSRAELSSTAALRRAIVLPAGLLVSLLAGGLTAYAMELWRAGARTRTARRPDLDLSPQPG
jgi:polysaccharide biosynthesis transport protein